MRVRTLMRRRFIAVAPEESLLEVWHLMQFARLRLLPVVRDGVLVGTVSFRELARALLAGAERRLAERLAAPIEEVMASGFENVPPEAGLEVAARELCAHEQGCLPVVETGADGPRLVGLVTEHDLLEATYAPRPR
jgi:CBS domain-containing protein